jgi:hypothetical protein
MAGMLAPTVSTFGFRPTSRTRNATRCVLNNGVSMDAEGLRWLWRIAFSPKNGIPSQYGRPLLGKFGIGLKNSKGG